MWSDHHEWAVLLRTVQPENAWVLVNLRFVSPWKPASLKPTREPVVLQTTSMLHHLKITVEGFVLSCIVSVIALDVVWVIYFIVFDGLKDYSILPDFVTAWKQFYRFARCSIFTYDTWFSMFLDSKNNKLINLFKTQLGANESYWVNQIINVRKCYLY